MKRLGGSSSNLRAAVRAIVSRSMKNLQKRNSHSNAVGMGKKRRSGGRRKSSSGKKRTGGKKRRTGGKKRRTSGKKRTGGRKKSSSGKKHRKMRM